MKTDAKKMRLAEGMLLMTAMIWGSGFVVMKQALVGLPVHLLLGIRFTIAAVLMLVILRGRLFSQTRADLLRGCLLGVVMYAAYTVQTYGLLHTTAGRNAFLTAVYVVLVPLLVCAVKRTRATLPQMGAALLCLAGTGVLVLQNGLRVGIGDALSLLCGVFYAVHIMLVDRFVNKTDPVILTAVQFAVSGTIGLACFLLFEKPPVVFSNGSLFSLFYLGVIGTFVALTMQNVAIRHADPSHASLIMGMEALFGALFGSLFLFEPVTLRFVLGGGMILCAIVVSEIRMKRLNDGVLQACAPADKRQQP
jgi:drug/metabolite transporter (DMT)-like permease